jgi:hypothetical protein
LRADGLDQRLSRYRLSGSSRGPCHQRRKPSKSSHLLALYLLQWSQAVADFDMLYYGADDSYLAPPLFPASLGNGNIAFELGNPRFYMTGVFNGFNTTTPSHRAALPALFAQKFESNSPTQSLSTLCAALDLKNGIYYRRLLMFDSETRRSVVVEQRLYAHQTRSDLFVVEIELLEGKQSHSLSTNQKPSAVHSWHLKMTAFESNASTADDLLWRDVSNKTPGTLYSFYIESSI